MTRTLPLAVAAATAAILLPAPPADATHGCSSSGAKLRQRTVEARVFTKGAFREERVPLYWACAEAKGSIYRLNPRGEFGPTEIFRTALSGHFVAFARDDRCGACSGFFTHVIVKSLFSGRDLYREAAPADQEEGDGGVTALVVKRNGSVAWLARDFTGGDEETQVVARDGDGRRLLDRGPGIAPGSLALSENRATIYWLHDGAPRSATLR